MDKGFMNWGVYLGQNLTWIRLRGSSLVRMEAWGRRGESSLLGLLGCPTFLPQVLTHSGVLSQLEVTRPQLCGYVQLSEYGFSFCQLKKSESLKILGRSFWGAYSMTVVQEWSFKKPWNSAPTLEKWRRLYRQRSKWKYTWCLRSFS